MMRGEHEQSVTIYNKNNTFLEIEGNRERILRKQKWCIDLCVKEIVMFQGEALDSYQKRWMMSPIAVQNREPFGVPNFARVLSHVLRHVACIQTCGVQWMGLQFRFPIIRFPVEHYTMTYNVLGDLWNNVLLTEG